MEKRHGHRISITCIKDISSPYGFHDKKDDIPWMGPLSREEFPGLQSLAFHRLRGRESRMTFFDRMDIPIFGRMFEKQIFCHIGYEKKCWIESYLHRNIFSFVFG